jgi:hypothetical protein
MRSSSASDQIKAIYDIVQNALPLQIGEQLSFLRPDPLPSKSGAKGTRGRIMGASAGKIWSSKWCFYEIGIGCYSDPSFANKGAIGFVSYPENKDCGSGKHRQFLTTYVRTISRRFSGFTASDSSGGFQGAFRYYRNSCFPSFPTDQAAADLAVLISATFEQIHSMSI